MTHDELIDWYERLSPELARRGEELTAALSGLISGHEPPPKVHSVRMRVKTPASLAAKLARPDKTYRHLWDVTDLLGLRVITYFEDDVASIGHLIERHLEVDFQHSIDKRRARPGEVAPRFGYRSLHYVCALPGFAASTSGIAPRFEIQIRTVLEHAWAEIEHDLGYKSRDALPATSRRRLQRLAGLLELADQEFSAIRGELADYARRVPERLEKDEDLPLDLHSLEWLMGLPECAALDHHIAQHLGTRPSTAPFFPDYLLRMLRLVGFERVLPVRQTLERHVDEVIALAAPYFAFARRTFGLDPEALRGYGLFLLAHWRALAPQDGAGLTLDQVMRLAALYRELDYPHDEREAHRVASLLLDALREHGVRLP